MAPGTFPSRALRRVSLHCKQKREDGLKSRDGSRFERGFQPSRRARMQIGVYGSGYLGTVISACLADFGTPVSLCLPDRTCMVKMAQGNMPFFEKNLNERF